MNIVLCVKAVSTKLVYSNDQREEKLTLNPYDLLALEKLIAIKKKIDCTITCVCMGTLDASTVLVHCMAMGADDAILLSNRKFAGADTYATTYTLYKAIQKLDYDVIVCGAQAIDGETGQVTYGLAQRLGLPCITDVLDINDLHEGEMTVEAKRVKDIKIVNIKLPAVISFRNFRTDSGKISLLALKKAQKKQIKVWTAEDLSVDLNLCGQAGSKTQVLNAGSILEKKNTCFLEGTPEARLQFLIEKIKLYSND